MMKQLFVFIFVCTFTSHAYGMGTNRPEESAYKRCKDIGPIQITDRDMKCEKIQLLAEQVKIERKRSHMFATLAACAGTLVARHMAGDEHPVVKVGATVAAVPNCVWAAGAIIKNMMQ